MKVASECDGLCCAACSVSFAFCIKSCSGGFFSPVLRQVCGRIWCGGMQWRGCDDLQIMHRVHACGESESSSLHGWTSCCYFAHGYAMFKCTGCSCERGQDRGGQWCMVHASAGPRHSSSVVSLLSLISSFNDNVNCLCHPDLMHCLAVSLQQPSWGRSWLANSQIAGDSQLALKTGTHSSWQNT